MKTKVSNSFTCYEATINHREVAPSAATMRKHIRKSKAKDCTSATIFIREDGAKIMLDPDHGPDCVFIQEYYGAAE